MPEQTGQGAMSVLRLVLGAMPVLVAMRAVGHRVTLGRNRERHDRQSDSKGIGEP